MLTKFNSLLPFDFHLSTRIFKMKLKKLLAVCGLGLCFMSSAFAAEHLIHPSALANRSNTAEFNKAMMPGFCEIEVLNRTGEAVSVYGTFRDGAQLNVDMGAYTSYYYNLYYPDYDGLWRCHYYMYLTITNYHDNWSYPLYDNYYAQVNTSIVVGYGLAVKKQLKVEVTKK